MFYYIIWKGIDGINIGFITIRFYSLMFVLAFLFGFKIMEFIFDIDKENKKKLDQIFIYTFLGTILGARLGHIIFYDIDILINDPISVFLPFSFFPNFHLTGFHGLASHGAFIGVVISSFFSNYFYLNKNPLWLLDRMVIPFTLGAFFVRLGNFFNSEIIGKPCNSFFAILFIKQSKSYGKIVARHPAQIYESISYFIFFIILIFIYLKTNKKKYLGWLFGFFMLVIFTIRFFIEYIKEPQGLEYTKFLNFNTGQTLSIPMIIIGMLILFLSKKNKNII